MESFSFNLVDEPWIPCVDSIGEYRLLSLRETLCQAHEIRGLTLQNPLTEAALLRILLALVHRVVDGPKDRRQWVGLYRSKRLPEDEAKSYLDKWHNRFDLFSKDAPFYQAAGLRLLDSSGKPAPVSVSNVMLERSSGHNKTLFDHTTDDMVIRLTPAEAILILITAQMFSLSGLNKKTTNLFDFQQSYLNAPMVSGIFITLCGRNLFETLLLNLLICKDNEPIPNTDEDCPVWERREDAGVGKTNPKGYLDYLTCQCRHLLLVPQQDESGIFVASLHIAQGEAFPLVENPAFFKKRNKKGKWYSPQLDAERLLWRDSLALFSFDDKEDRRPKVFRQVQNVTREVPLASRYLCQAFALANDNANPLAWRKETLNVPVSMFSDQETVASLKKAINFSESSAAVLEGAVRCYIRKYLPQNSKESDVRNGAAATGTMRLFWDHLEHYFHVFLGEMEQGKNALEEWKSNVKRTAHESFEACLRYRYADTARAYRAWSASFDQLNAKLSALSKEGGAE